MLSKKCPNCGSRLDFKEVIGLSLNFDYDPSRCDDCGALFTNTRLGIAVPMLLLFAGIVGVALADVEIFSIESIPYSIAFVIAWFAMKYMFSSPKLVGGRKSFCPVCKKKDAIYAWSTDSPVCLACQHGLNSGEDSYNYRE